MCVDVYDFYDNDLKTLAKNQLAVLQKIYNKYLI